MKLEWGKCYEIQYADDRSVAFKFIDSEASNGPLAEVPPGSGNKITLSTILDKPQLAYWEIDCP